MANAGYRVLISLVKDPESGAEYYVATAPELAGLKATADNRAEALELLVKEIDSHIQDAASSGEEVRQPIDQTEFGGSVEVDLSPYLHRELAWQAALEGIELKALVAEILAAGLEYRKRIRIPRRPVDEQPDSEEAPRRRERRDRMDRHQYHQVMEDKASFLEYVRGLETGRQGGGGGRGGGGGGRGGRGRRG